MTIRNTSRYRTEHVRALVLFAARAMLVQAYDPLRVRVTACGRPYVGEARVWSVSIGIGGPEHFPHFGDRMVRGAPRVLHVDWQEAIVATAAHEFAHVRQATRWLAAQTRAALEVADGIPTSAYDEVEAERAARAALVVFRGERRRVS